MTFCTNCGTRLKEGSAFCTKCGAQGKAPGAPAPPPAQADAPSSATPEAAPQSVAPLAIVVPAAKSVAPIPKIALAGIAIVLLLVAVIAAGFIYAAHRAKQKAVELESADNVEKNIADLAAAADKMAQKAQETGAIPAIPGGSSPSNTSPSNNSSSGSSASAPAAVPSGWRLENGKLVPAKPPKIEAPPFPKADPVAPVAATGNQAHDWALKYERTEGGPEADLVVRTGDINNLGFGWPTGFDPFSGKSTPPHQWLDINRIPPGAPDGTDRIMLGSAVIPAPGDGYSGALGDCVIAQQVPTPAHAHP